MKLRYWLLLELIEQKAFSNFLLNLNLSKIVVVLLIELRLLASAIISIKL